MVAVELSVIGTNPHKTYHTFLLTTNGCSSTLGKSFIFVPVGDSTFIVAHPVNNTVITISEKVCLAQ